MAIPPDNQEQMSPLQQEQQIPIVPNPDEPQPIQVAGRVGEGANFIGDMFKSVFGETADVTKKPTPKTNQDSPDFPASESSASNEQPLAQQDEAGNIFVRRATQDELAELVRYRDDTDRLEDDMDIILPNLDKVSLTPLLAKEGQTLKNATQEAEIQLRSTIQAVYEKYKNTIASDGKKILRKGERGFEQVIKDAQKISSVDIFLDLMKRNPSDRLFNDAELLAARNVVLSLQMEANRLIKIAEKTGTDEDVARALQAISLEGYSSIQLVGIQESYGRGLAVNKIIAAPSKSRIDRMRTLLETSTGNVGPSAQVTEENAVDFLAAYGGREAGILFMNDYKNLPADGTRHRFARRSIMRRGADMLTEIYQSALLSNPITHGFNTVGNVVMAETLMIERFLEGRPQEAFAMLKAHFKYLPQALRAMYVAGKTERPIADQTSKLDTEMRAVSRQGAGLRSAEEGGGAMESSAAMFFDGAGIMLRMLGFRPMMAIDEFQKAGLRGMQLEALATRAKTDAYRAAIKDGATKAEAKARSESQYLEVLHSESAFEEASEFARMATFQDDLPSYANYFSGFFSHPITKIFAPFYKTPINVFRRITERTPLGLALPDVFVDKIIKGSPQQRREALTRITTGTGFGVLTMSLASGSIDDDFVITGYGPTNPKERANWLETHEPYSIGIRQEDGSWVYTGYSRYDPISGILAMAADTAHTLQYVDDDGMADDLVLNVGLATMKYIGESHPMVQFLGEMHDVAGGAFSGETKVMKVREALARQVTNYGLVIGQAVGTAGLGPQSLTATLERYMDPYKRSVMPEERFGYVPGVGLQPEIRGVYEALDYAMSRIPGLSNELPIRRNRWYEPQMQVYSTEDEEGMRNAPIWTTFSPFRVINKPQKNVVNEELEELGLGFYNLPRSMGESKLVLTGEQYDRYIQLYNNPMEGEYNKSINARFPNNPITINTVLDEFQKTIKSDAYKNLPTKKLKIKALRDIDSIYRGLAKEQMLFEYPELRALVQQREAYEDSQGRNPSMLFDPTKQQLEQAQKFNDSLLK